MSGEIASLGALLALGNPDEENPRRKRGKRRGKRRGRSRVKTITKYRSRARRRGRRNPKSGGRFGRFGGGLKGVVRNYGAAVVTGGLAAAGAGLLAAKAEEALAGRIPGGVYGSYGLQAAAGIGATMAAKKFLGSRMAGTVGAVSAALLGLRIINEQVMPRLSGAASAETAGLGMVYGDAPRALGAVSYADVDWPQFR